MTTTTHQTVQEAYGRIATQAGTGCCGGSGCCGGGAEADQLAVALGYSADELAAIPEGSNLGLSCGNPTALASLRMGETVLDLGSGAGFDVFVAAAKVGPAGRAIGVDMTKPMLAKARDNAAAFRRRTGLDNVEFRLGQIEALPLLDGTVDVVISNCVVNLSPDSRPSGRRSPGCCAPVAGCPSRTWPCCAPCPKSFARTSSPWWAASPAPRSWRTRAA